MIDQLSQCRMSGHGQYLSPADFRSLSCANCLFFIYLITPPYTSIYRTQICADGLEICAREDPNCGDCSNKEFIFNLPDFARNRSHATDLALLQLGPPLPPAYELFTRQCCEAAWDCCTGPLQKQSRNTKCPSTWDGWQCFGEASPGEIIGRCPAYIYGDQPKQNEGKFAVKQCTENGWQTSTSTKTEWTDYRGCKVVEEEAQIKLIAGILSFSLSVLALIPALLILTCFRSVRTQSVFVIHKHLLLSFLLSGVSYLINIFLFIVDGAPGDMLHMTNHIGCRLLFAIQLRFFRLSTFSWMLAEGVYLFRLLRNAFSDDESLTPYKIICWGGPLVLTIVYSILRQVFDNEGCWISPSIHNFIEWTVMAPCLIAICTNLLLVTLILYILVKKLRYNPHLEPVQYRKAVRAALMLVPVFGLHFLLTIYRVPSQAHQVLNLVLDGLQGFAVSVILCYANRSVMESVKKWISGIKESRLLKEEHKAALKRCESARSGHKKSIAEQASLTGHRGSRDDALTLTAALNGTSNGNGITNGAGDRYDNTRSDSKNARLSVDSNNCRLALITNI